MNRRRKWLLGTGITLVLFFMALFVFLQSPISVSANAWIEETKNVVAEYSKYPIDNYQLDFYVDMGWDWLPWQWGDGLAHTAYYALYLITCFIWSINVALSYLVGYVLQEAYSLDFIGDMIGAVSTNIQALAGVDKSGFKASGLYPSLVPFLILVLGAYVVWVGMLKKHFAKAISAILIFTVLLVGSMGFIAYSDGYLNKINDFSKDFNTAVLDITSKMIMPNSPSAGKNPEVAMRDMLFEIQIKKPYLILQYGTMDETKIGEDRIDELLSQSPYDNDSDREDIAKNEVEDEENSNMGFQMVPERLGMVLLVSVLNLVIDVCILVLAGLTIYAQIMFIIYVMFLVIALLAALIPNQQKTALDASLKVVNALFTKVGITLILTISMVISNMMYGLTENGSFLWMMIVQIIVFVAILFKTNELLGYVHLKAEGAGSVTGFAKGVARYGMMKSVTNAIGRKRPSFRNRNATRQDNTRKKDVETDRSKFENLGKRYTDLKDLKNKPRDMAKEVAKMPERVKNNMKKKKDEFDTGRAQREAELYKKRTQGQKKQKELEAQRRKELEHSADRLTPNGIKGNTSVDTIAKTNLDRHLAKRPLPRATDAQLNKVKNQIDGEKLGNYKYMNKNPLPYTSHTLGLRADETLKNRSSGTDKNELPTSYNTVTDTVSHASYRATGEAFNVMADAPKELQKRTPSADKSWQVNQTPPPDMSYPPSSRTSRKPVKQNNFRKTDGFVPDYDWLTKRDKKDTDK
ncbi:CD3337/EF1877 family mobilome membrane protein [Listeria ilorinensis]|uniref:CD3337/EF1877 family mobilome membrane protein n=1 Tax=Listeria ilorinensis TaxID=2867439 RepID=UPI001EF42C2F|nr:hypothetical protein [Listeria ilorinensis]